MENEEITILINLMILLLLESMSFLYLMFFVWWLLYTQKITPSLNNFMWWKCTFGQGYLYMKMMILCSCEKTWKSFIHFIKFYSNCDQFLVSLACSDWNFQRKEGACLNTEWHKNCSQHITSSGECCRGHNNSYHWPTYSWNCNDTYSCLHKLPTFASGFHLWEHL